MSFDDDEVQLELDEKNSEKFSGLPGSTPS
jgi:hypothetical protein